MIHLNIQSFRDKLDDLKLLLHSIENRTNKKMHIIALSEIWIYQNENFLYQIEEYEAFFSNRKENRSGGCCLFVHKSLDACLIKELEFELSNFIVIKLSNPQMEIACICI